MKELVNPLIFFQETLCSCDVVTAQITHHCLPDWITPFQDSVSLRSELLYSETKGALNHNKK